MDDTCFVLLCFLKRKVCYCTPDFCTKINANGQSWFIITKFTFLFVRGEENIAAHLVNLGSIHVNFGLIC